MNKRGARRKYTKYKKCHSKIFACSKQHLSNIWGSIHEKVKQHWDVAYKNKRVIDLKKINFPSKLWCAKLAMVRGQRNLATWNQNV